MKSEEVKMRSVTIEYLSDHKAIRVDAYGADGGGRYIGIATGKAAATLLSGVTTRLSAALPDKPVPLIVVGFKIANDQTASS